MRRHELAQLPSPAATVCRRAVLAGAWFHVDDTAQGSVPASGLAAICARRQVGTTAVGVPSTGFPDAVAALRGLGDQPVRLGSVRVDDPPYHWQLFLDETLTTVVAVIGVDLRLGYRLRVGDAVLIRAEAVGRVDPSFPGWLRVRLADASGRSWHLTERAPVFDVDVTDGRDFPAPVAVRGVVTDLRPVDGGPPLVVVSTAPDGVAAEDGTDEFTLPGESLRRAPCRPGG